MEVSDKWKWASLAITTFVLGTAVVTKNPVLFLLAGLSGAATAARWVKRKPKI